MGDLAEGGIRLRDFLIQRFGGPDRYHERAKFKGDLGITHSWMEITPTVRDRWIEMMTEAMDEVGLAGPARRRLEEHFGDVSRALVTQAEFSKTYEEFLARTRPPAKPFDAYEDEDL